jgi:hypothetical protein
MYEFAEKCIGRICISTCSMLISLFIFSISEDVNARVVMMYSKFDIIIFCEIIGGKNAIVRPKTSENMINQKLILKYCILLII